MIRNLAARPQAVPAVFGAFSLDGAPLPPRGERALVPLVDRLAVYGAGDSPDVHAYADEERACVVFGRTDSAARVAFADPAELAGAFAAVRYDRRSCRLELLTDKYGLRPLFYARDGGRLLFATHLDALRDLLEELPAIDEEVLLHRYCFSFTQSDRTLLRGIRKVPPASRLVADGSGIDVARYFRVASLRCPDRFAGWSEHSLCEEIDAALSDAVGRILTPGEPVAIALSGGVDSGYLAQKAVQCGADLKGYTLAYGESYDEFDRVDVLARALDIEVARLRLGPEEIIEGFEHSAGLASEPLGFNNSVLRFVGRAARADGRTTLLDGDGADRLFLGMNRFARYGRLVRAYRFARRSGLLPVVRPLLRLLPGNELRKVRLKFENWSRGIPPYPERGLGRTRGYDPAFERRVYDLAVARYRRRFEEEVGEGDFGLFFTYVAIHMCPEMFFHDPAELHLEAGVFPVPAFWDDRVVGLALSLPTAWKLRGKTTKYVLRRAAALRIAPEYWMLPKIGLQSAFDFAVRSPAGAAWLARRREQVRASGVFATLRGIVPRGDVEADRLIPLLVWQEQHGLAADL